MTKDPDYIVSTGDFIAEWMDEEGINAAELSRRLGVTRKHVSELLHGKAPLTHRVALALERVTGVPARIWNQYESGYRSDLAREEQREVLLAQYPRAKAFPLPYLRKWKFITAPARDRVETVQQLLSLLGVASLDAFDTTWSHGSVAYRRAAVGREDTPALATWLALAERHHDGRGELPAFDRSGLEALLPRLRTLTRADPNEAIPSSVSLLRAVGVHLCFIPAVPGLGVHGATRWLNGNPIIQLSLLGKSDDQFWFTLFHELGHVLLHGSGELYLHGEDSSTEEEANVFASTLLVPQEAVLRLPRSRSVQAVEALAEELGVAPSIVLGRAQRETRDYGWGHGLKRKLEFTIEAE